MSNRKAYPMFTGLLAYFPDALRDVSNVSFVGNIQHSGECSDLKWDRTKSVDQRDAGLRHMTDDLKETFDTDGCRHLAKAAWRALAALQLAIEADKEPK